MSTSPSAATTPWLAYGQSRTANVLFAVEATRRRAADRITANAVMPGAVYTNLQRHTEGGRGSGSVPPELIKTVEQGAATAVLAAVSPLPAGLGGCYLFHRIRRRTAADLTAERRTDVGGAEHPAPMAVLPVPHRPSYNWRMPSKTLHRRYAAACAAGPSYPEVGATRSAALPPGYSWLRRRIHLGHGPAVLDRAGAYVLGWGTQLGSGFAVYPPPVRIAAGDTVLLRIGVPRLTQARLVIPCRVIWTVEQPDRIGFAYGTLPGHPECGEESFVVSMDADGDVWFEVTAFSRLAAWYARLGRPVALMLQHLAIERYLRVVARAAAAG